MDQSPKIKISIFIQHWVVDNVQIERKINQHPQCGINVPIWSWMGKGVIIPMEGSIPQ